VLAAAFNFWYNLREIIGRFAEGDASHAAEVSRAAVNDAFWTVQWFVNGLLFPIAIAIIAWYVRPVALGLWSLNRGEAPSDLARSRLRERILGIGAVIVTVGGVGWLIAGLTFPLATEWFLPEDGLRLPASFYWHFIVSMIACGAFSSALPYLASTWLALRVYLPRLIDSTKLSVQERLRMERTGRRSGVLVLVSFVAPMLAMLLLTLHPPKDPLPLLVLIAGGIFGAIGAYWMNQSIQDDLQILLAVLRAAEAEDTVTDSFDSQRLGNSD
jgi:MFS family permease